MSSKKARSHSQVHGRDAKPAREAVHRSAAGGSRAAGSPVAIDYPAEGERVAAGHYAVRVGAPEGWEVQVTLDGRTWESCRSASGYYWFDWFPTEAGPRSLRARGRRVPGRASAGRWRLSEPRACIVAESSR